MNPESVVNFAITITTLRSKVSMALTKAYYVNGTSAVEIRPITGSGSSLPSTSLTMSPGNYTFSGNVYDCSAEGLYRFWHWGDGTTNDPGNTQQRISYSSNIPALMSAICWITAHGLTDESLGSSDPTQWTARALKSKLRLRCGYKVQWAQSILSGLSITSRKTAHLTGEAMNGVDDGHVAIEVSVSGSWRFWDLTNCFMCLVRGKPASLKEMTAEAFDIVFVGPRSYEIQPFPTDVGTPDLAIYYESSILNVEQLNRWVNRIYQVPGLTYSDGGIYAYLPPGTEAAESYVETYWNLVSQSTWNSMFY